MMPGDLEGVSVLIPRPVGRGNDLVQTIDSLGGESIRFPVLEIELCPCATLLQPNGLTLDQFVLAVFVSVNSVKALAQALSDASLFPADLAVAAMGQATADELTRLGIDVRFLPEGSHDSEGLLRSISNLPVEGHNVVIYRGNHGRDFLAENLRQRGAHVHLLESYRHRLHRSPPQGQLLEWLSRPNSVLLVTSVTILKALVLQTPVKHRTRLFTQPVVCLSPRIASACRAAGFHGLVQATNRTDSKAITQALVTVSTVTGLNNQPIKAI